MARDYFGISASSVIVERQFSGGTNIFGPKRTCLTPDSLEVCQELKEYMKFGGQSLFDLLLEQLQKIDVETFDNFDLHEADLNA